MPIQALPFPHWHGWIVSDQPGEDQDSVHGQKVKICWMTLPPAPAALLELVSCKCQAGCVTQRCTCQSAGLLCTSVCQCSQCQNIRVPLTLAGTLSHIESNSESEGSEKDEDNDNDGEGVVL